MLVATIIWLPTSSQADESKNESPAGETSKIEDNEKKPAATNPKSLDDFKGLGPKETYLKMHDIFMKADSFSELKPFMAEETLTRMMAKGTAPKNRSHVDQGIKEEQIFKLMKTMMYPKVKVVSVKIDGDTAVLKAVPDSVSMLDKGIEDMADGLSNSLSKAFTGKDAPKSKKPQKKSTTGTITMKLEDGIWKQVKEKWHTKIGDGSSSFGSSRKAPNKWCASAKTAEFLKKPATGKLGGKPFTVYEAEYDDFVNTLTLKGPGKSFDKPRITIFLFNKQKVPYGQSFKCPMDSFGAPHIHLRRKVDGKMKTDIYTGSNMYGMSLSFNQKPTNGKLTGYIILRMPDKEKSELNGYFHATVK